MGLFKTIFGKKTNSLNDLRKMPPVYGGDAQSVKTAAIINCAAMSTANDLINHFISELHGQKDADWKRSVEFFVNDSCVPEYTVRAIGVNLVTGEKITYFFNLARPMSATKKLMKAMGMIPDGI